MESNLFIKSYKAEGNKITDLQFYGDMEIDIGSGGGSGPTYNIDVKPVNILAFNTLPFGLYIEKTKVLSSGYIQELKVTNLAKIPYRIHMTMNVMNKGGTFDISPESEVTIATNGSFISVRVCSSDDLSLIGFKKIEGKE